MKLLACARKGWKKIELSIKIKCMDKKPTKIPDKLTNKGFIKSARHFGISEAVEDKRYPLHWHEFYEMELVLSGEGLHILNGISYPMVKGSLFLLTPSDFHEVIAREGFCLKLLNVKFSEGTLNDQLREMLFTEKGLLMVALNEKDFGSIESEFRRMMLEEADSGIGRDIIIRGALERVLVELVRRCSFGEKATTFITNNVCNEQSINKSLLYIQQHFREPITLENAAGQSHLSPNYFSECFHKRTGRSFQNYIQELRLQFAATLLDCSELTVTDICFTAGFNTLAHFHRTFKKRFGTSPRNYRKK